MSEGVWDPGNLDLKALWKSVYCTEGSGLEKDDSPSLSHQVCGHSKDPGSILGGTLGLGEPSY